MRTGYKVAAAGLVVVLGCSIAAFAPFGFSNPIGSTRADGQSTEQAGVSQDAKTVSEEESSPESGGIVGSAEACEGEGSEQDDDGAPTYVDGVYRASAAGKVGQVPVTVTIEDGAITDIRVGQNSEVTAMAEKAQRYVVPQILELQTTEGVDAASGATLTSEAIIDAVAQALERASAE